MNENIKIIIFSVVAAAVAGGFSGWAVVNFKTPSKEELIKEFYLIENAVHVSPHTIRKKMADGDTGGFILIDLRSAEEYEKEHIAGAISIPAYKDPEHSAYDEKDRIIGAFRQLPKDKDVIVYCYSMPCMTGRKIGQMLAENGIYVKHLGIGWNEWRYYWNLWNHDGEASSKMENYIVSGKEPGAPKTGGLPSPCGEGEFNC
ncbi:rhodanese-like domain-containing protein [Candidatus Wolfebacteria bacterium]|nr:rhodanese-like domain-containing protein [Candidatus Wolfebacteria bacterium]